MSTSPTYLSGPVPQGSQIGRYFSFRLMITPTLINAIYIVGLLGITIFSVYLMVHGAPAQAMMTPFGVVQSGGNSGVLDGVILLTGGNLLWRIYCELMVVIFALHRAAESIDEKLPVSPGR